jgi:hypothetical protein
LEFKEDILFVVPKEEMMTHWDCTVCSEREELRAIAVICDLLYQQR